MLENKLIAKFKSDELKGIVETEHCFYMPIRVTGTGNTIRADDEGNLTIQERLKAAYFTPNVLEVCSHLPITLDHPDGLLSSKTIDEAKIVGNTVAAKMVDEEIWALAKIFDNRLIDKLNNTINSTSPGIFSFVGIMPQSGNGTSTQEVPAEINHIALVDKGHWDQKGTKGFDDSMHTKIIERIDTMAKELPLNDTVEPVNVPVEKKVEIKPEVAKDSAEVEIKPEVAKDSAEVEIKPEVAKDSAEVEIKPEVAKDSAEVEIKPEVAKDSAEVEIPIEPVHEVPDHLVEPEIAVETHHDNEEVIDNEPTEVIESAYEEKLDAERDSLLSQMRKICDSAHPNLDVRMPRIELRETPRSVIAKFMSRNPGFVNKKYHQLTLESLSDELAVEIFNDTKHNIEAANEKYVAKPLSGFVQSAKGYSVDSQF